MVGKSTSEDATCPAQEVQDAGGAGDAGADLLLELGEVPWPFNVVQAEPNGRYIHVETGIVLGVIHDMGMFSLKATCKAKGHTNCGCWVTLRPPMASPAARDQLERELVEWIAFGAADSVEAHLARSADIRRAKGMSVRAKG